MNYNNRKGQITRRHPTPQRQRRGPSIAPVELLALSDLILGMDYAIADDENTRDSVTMGGYLSVSEPTRKN